MRPLWTGPPVTDNGRRSWAFPRKLRVPHYTLTSRQAKTSLGHTLLSRNDLI